MTTLPSSLPDMSKSPLAHIEQHDVVYPSTKFPYDTNDDDDDKDSKVGSLESTNAENTRIPPF
jgi:hypothetical protein